MNSTEDQVKIFYGKLLSETNNTPNDIFLAKVTASWVYGKGILPDMLGLDAQNFSKLLLERFKQENLQTEAASGIKKDPAREEERQNLKDLFAMHRTSDIEETGIIAEIIISGCLGNDHLWQDLGLWSRNDLSEVLKNNFTSLFEKNVKDMKWKKFFYKQLCDAEGIYTCRSPSCEVCNDYSKCFGPEE